VRARFTKPREAHEAREGRRQISNGFVVVVSFELLRKALPSGT
jgi:hypothetical protein